MKFELLGRSDRKYQDYRKVYNYIYEQKYVTKSKLMELTGFKLSTLNRIVNGLLEEKMIMAVEAGESNGGRKPLVYGIYPLAGYVAAVDITRTYMRVALTDLNCNVIKYKLFGIFEDTTPDIAIKRIVETVLEFASDPGIDNLLGIGLGVVGPVDREKGIILNPVNFPAAGWENVSLKDRIEEATGLRVLVENGANAAALGEYTMEYKNKFNYLAYVVAGVGLRLGLIVNGKPVGSESRSDGEFGHVTVDVNGELCTCGKRGCLDRYVSINTVLSKFKESIKNGKNADTAMKVDYDIGAVTPDRFFEAVDGGNEAALEIVRDTAEYFSAGLANMINIMNPGLIVLGGILIRKCPLLYQMTEELTRGKISRHLYSQVVFSKGILGENAVVAGAAKLILNWYMG